MRQTTGERRAQSFASVADAYERARPGYPEDAVRWLAGEAPCDVVDLGAGTGKLTRTLVALGHRVTAVEPLPEMLAHLREALPGGDGDPGERGAMPLPGASADVVTVAQAFHWFDPEPALREIARVLRPGGRIALVWNTRDDREPWVAELSAAVTGREGIDRVTRHEGSLVASGLFDPVEHETFALATTSRSHRVARARALAQLLRRDGAGGAGAGARRHRSRLRPPCRRGRNRAAVLHRVLPRRASLTLFDELETAAARAADRDGPDPCMAEWTS